MPVFPDDPENLSRAWVGRPRWNIIETSVQCAVKDEDNSEGQEQEVDSCHLHVTWAPYIKKWPVRGKPVYGIRRAPGILEVIKWQ